MNAYQLIMIFYESISLSTDRDSFKRWFAAAKDLNEKLTSVMPAGVLSRRPLSGVVMLAFPEQEMLDGTALEHRIKLQAEEILGAQYRVRILYTNFLVPENALDDMTQHAIDQYEHLTDPNSTMVLLDLGQELHEMDSNVNFIDVAKNILQSVEEGRFESARMMFLQIMTMFRYRRSNVLTRMFMRACMSTLLLLSGMVNGSDVDEVLYLLNDAVIGPDWQSYVLYGLEEICRRQRNNRSTRFDSFELRVHDYVDRDITNSKLDLKKTAENFGLTPTYFSQVFKEQMGIGFQAYVEQLRMQIGYDLLRQRDMTVSRAARECGYENVGTFRRNFKKHFGINPGEIMT